MPAPTAPASPSRARPIVVRADRADASSSRASILPAWLTRGGTVTSAPSRPFGLASRGSPLLSDAAASPRFGAREMGLRDRAASFVRRIGQFEPRDALAWIVVQDGGLGELEVPTSHGDDVESSSADDDALDDAAEADPTGAEIHHGSSPHLRSIEAMGRRSSAPRDQARLAAAASRAAERRRAHSLRRRPQRSRVIARLDRIRRGLGLSRSAAILLVALLLFGVLEIARRNPGADIATQRAFVLPRTSEVDPTRHTSAVWLEQLRVPGPAEPLLLPYRAVNRPAFSRRSRNNLQHRPAIGPAPMPPFGEPPDMTAIILGYRRPAHLQLAVTHLCRYVGTLFSEVLVVNNNAERPLTPSFFTDAGATCPPHALKIRNLRNMMFVSRFLACSTVSAAHCFLADDDFVTWPLRSLCVKRIARLS